MTDRATKATSEPDDSASALRANTAAMEALTEVVRDSLEPTPRLLTVEQVSQALQVSKSTICKLIREGLFPEPMKLGGASRWRGGDISLYIARRGQWTLKKRRRSRA